MRSRHARFSLGALHIRYPIQARKRGQKMTANPFSPTEETLVKALMCAKSPSALKSVGNPANEHCLSFPTVATIVAAKARKTSSGSCEKSIPSCTLLASLSRSSFAAGRQKNSTDRRCSTK
jgi:hypothetical protein